MLFGSIGGTSGGLIVGGTTSGLLGSTRASFAMAAPSPLFLGTGDLAIGVLAKLARVFLGGGLPPLLGRGAAAPSAAIVALAAQWIVQMPALILEGDLGEEG